MRPTIKDIANDSNLSISTVSKYINNKTVLPENKIKIEASIKKLGFVPDKNAQNMRLSRTKTQTIGIVVPGFSNYFWGSIAVNIEDIMRKNDYSIYICSQFKDGSMVEDILSFLMQKRVDGIIIVPKKVEIKNIEQINVPIITIDQYINSNISCVTSDNYDAAYKGTTYLIKHGHTKIAVVSGDKDGYTTKERVNGYKKAMEDKLIDVPRDYISYGDYTIDSGREQFRELIKLTEPPTAIFVLGYDLGIGTLFEAKDLNIRVKNDISLLFFDDNEIFAAMNPPITTIAQDFEKMGEIAANLLLKKIDYDNVIEDESNIIMLGTTMKERDSVANLN